MGAPPQEEPWSDGVRETELSDDEKNRLLEKLFVIDAQLTRVQRALGLKQWTPSGIVSPFTSRSNREPIRVDGVPYYCPEGDISFVALDLSIQRDRLGRTTSINYRSATIDNENITGFEISGEICTKPGAGYTLKSKRAALDERHCADDIAVAWLKKLVGGLLETTLCDRKRQVILVTPHMEDLLDVFRTIDFELDSITNILDVVDLVDLEIAVTMRHVYGVHRDCFDPATFFRSKAKAKEFQSMIFPSLTSRELCAQKRMVLGCDATVVTLQLAIKCAVKDAVLRPVQTGLLGNKRGYFHSPLLIPGERERYQSKTEEVLATSESVAHIQLSSPQIETVAAPATPFREEPMPDKVSRAYKTYKASGERFSKLLQDASNDHCRIESFTRKKIRSYPSYNRDTGEDEIVEDTIQIIAPPKCYLDLAKVVRDKAAIKVSWTLLEHLQKEIVGREVVDSWYRELPKEDSRKTKNETHGGFTEILKQVRSILLPTAISNYKDTMDIHKFLSRIEERVLEKGACI